MTYEPVSVESLLTHQDWALRLARRLVREEGEAEDLVQRTWMAALRRPPDSERGARAWIRKVILNLARERHRRGRTRERYERAFPKTEGDVPDTLEVLSRTEIRKMLSEQLLELAEPYRSAVLQRYYDGLSSVEIARRLGIPAGTVRWRLKVGLDQLRSELDRRAHGDRSRWISALLAFAPGGAETPDEAEGADDDATSEAPVREPSPALGLLGSTGWIPLAGVGLLGLVFLVRGAERDQRPSVVHAGEETPLVARASDQAVRRGAGSAERAPLPVQPSGPRTVSEAIGFGVLVVDENDLPVTGARVMVATASGFEERTVSDEDGRALLVVHPRDPGAIGLPATRGRVGVRALAEGREASALVHVAPPFSPEHEVRLVVGGPEVRLEGRVVDRGGQAIPGALVAWFNPDDRLDGLAEGDFASPSYLSTQSDSGGRFVLANLPRGNGNLGCYIPGFAFFSIVLEVPTRAPYEIVLQRGARVSGTVRWPDGRPAADVSVACEPIIKAAEWATGLPRYDAEWRGFGETRRTDEHGKFLLEGVKAGRERVLWARDERTGLVAMTTLALEDEGEAHWDAELAERTGFRLRLVDESGQALPGWFVCLRRPDNSNKAWWLRRRATDSEGRLFVPDCPDVEVCVDVYSPDDVGASHAWSRLRPSPEEVLIQVETRRLSSVTGCIVDAFGKPELRGELVFQSLNTTQGVSVPRDARGNFEQRLAPGQYRLVLLLDRTMVRLGRFRLARGEIEALGTLATPPFGTLRLDSTALQDGPTKPSYSIISVAKEEQSYQRVARGPLEAELLIPMFPGTYRVLAFDGGEKPIVHVVEVRSHAETRLELER